MSSIEQMNVEQLLEQRKKIDAAINAMGGAKTGKNEKKQKRKSTPAGPWAAWTTKVLAENKEAVEAFKLAAEKKIGAHLKWISENKGKDSAEYKAFAVEFAATHPKVSASEASSVVSAPVDEASEPASEAAPKKRGPKKLADMTPEERAAHDKKLAERRSKKEAEKVAVETVAKAEVAAPAPVAVAAPESSSVVEESDGEWEPTMELLPFKLDGVSYLRLGSKSADGEIEWAGDLWYNKKGVRGTYVGVLQDDGSIDTDAEEPNVE